MERRAMKQVFNWKDGDNLNFQYFYCLLKLANDVTCHEWPMSLTKQISITVTKPSEEFRLLCEVTANFSTDVCLQKVREARQETGY